MEENIENHSIEGQVNRDHSIEGQVNRDGVGITNNFRNLGW